MGLKIGEVFRDYCCLTVTATGARAIGLLDVTCQPVDETGTAFGAAIVATECPWANGWYYADITPDAAGTWVTDWSKTLLAANYTFHYWPKEFHVGAGQEADIYTRLGAPAGASISADILVIDNFVDDLETRLTAARAGYIDELAAANLPTDITDIHTDVGTAITDIGGVHTDVAHIHDTDLPDLHTDVGTVITAAGTAAAYAIVNSGQSFRGAVTAIPGANQFTIGTLAGLGAGIFIDANTPWYAYVFRDNGGLAAAPQGETRLITGYVTATGAFTTAAFSSAVEAGDDMIIMSAYLSNTIDTHTVVDNIHDTDLPDVHTDIGTVHTDVDAVRARTDRLEITKAFFGPCLIVGTVDTTHTDIALGSVTLPNIAGTITHVYAGFKFRMIENTNVAANKLNGAQEIQVDTVDAINFVDHQFGVAASTREGGDCIIGAVDLVATVDVFNHAYAFVWDEPLSEVDSLVFNDIQPFLIVSYY